MMVALNTEKVVCDTISYVLLWKKLSKIDASASVIVFCQQFFGMLGGWKTFATKSKKKKLFKPIILPDRVRRHLSIRTRRQGSVPPPKKQQALDKGDHYI